MFSLSIISINSQYNNYNNSKSTTHRIRWGERGGRSSSPWIRIDRLVLMYHLMSISFHQSLFGPCLWGSYGSIFQLYHLAYSPTPRLLILYQDSTIAVIKRYSRMKVEHISIFSLLYDLYYRFKVHSRAPSSSEAKLFIIVDLLSPQMVHQFTFMIPSKLYLQNS